MLLQALPERPVPQHLTTAPDVRTSHRVLRRAHDPSQVRWSAPGAFDSPPITLRASNETRKSLRSSRCMCVENLEKRRQQLETKPSIIQFWPDFLPKKKGPIHCIDLQLSIDAFKSSILRVSSPYTSPGVLSLTLHQL